MSVTIYVTGKGHIDNADDQLIGEIKNIENGWGSRAFLVSGNGSFKLKDECFDGLEPYGNGVTGPIKKLLKTIRGTDARVNAQFTVNSDCSNFNNIRIEINDNEIHYANSEIADASVNELKEELCRRMEDLIKRQTRDDIINGMTKDGRIGGYVTTDIKDIISMQGSEDFEDMLALRLIGNPLIKITSYEPVGFTENNEIVFWVTGDAGGLKGKL